MTHWNYDPTVRNKTRGSGCSCSVVGKGTGMMAHCNYDPAVRNKNRAVVAAAVWLGGSRNDVTLQL
jgi:hypothetical protein